jgi:hypothetical protein
VLDKSSLHEVTWGKEPVFFYTGSSVRLISFKGRSLCYCNKPKMIFAVHIFPLGPLLFSTSQEFLAVDLEAPGSILGGTRFFWEAVCLERGPLSLALRASVASYTYRCS